MDNIAKFELGKMPRWDSNPDPMLSLHYTIHCATRHSWFKINFFLRIFILKFMKFNFPNKFTIILLYLYTRSKEKEYFLKKVHIPEFSNGDILELIWL